MLPVERDERVGEGATGGAGRGEARLRTHVRLTEACVTDVANHARAEARSAVQGLHQVQAAVQKMRKAVAAVQKQQAALRRGLEIVVSRVSSVEDGEKFESDEMQREIEDLQERAAEIKAHVYGESAIHYMDLAAVECDDEVDDE